MSNFKIFFSVPTFKGDYDANETYTKSNVVKYTDKKAYKCKADTTKGDIPPDNTDIWEMYLPLEDNSNTLSVDTVQRLSTEYEFGDQEDTYDIEWRGQEWVLEKDGGMITLVKVVAHCNCGVCQCNCNCYCVNCQCALCECADTCPPNYYHYDYCTGYLSPLQCICNCECSSPACNCTNYNCYPGQEQCNCTRCTPC